MHNNHSTQLVNCSMDEPLQVLMDRLSSKSSELYIFWVHQNIFSKTTTNFTAFISKRPTK